MKVKNEIITSFDRDGKHYFLLEVAPYLEVKVMEDRWFNSYSNNRRSTNSRIDRDLTILFANKDELDYNNI